MTTGGQLRTTLICSILAALIPAGLARAAVDVNDFKTEADKVSYIIGTRFIAQLKAQGLEVNADLLIQGIRDTLAGEPGPFSNEEQNKIMMDFQQKMMAKLKARQEAEAMQQISEDKAWKLKLTKPEMMKFDPNKDYFWLLETNKGNIKIKLMPEVAPMHATCTIFLTNKGFYDGTTFHRVIPGFMAQGGCPLGTGTGSPGYKYDGEFSPNVKHDRPYLLSTANRGPGTDGSQFFITFKATPWLDGKHTIFGEVVEGQDTVTKLEAAGTPGQGKPTEELKIIKARIEEKPIGALGAVNQPDAKTREAKPTPPKLEDDGGNEPGFEAAALDPEKRRLTQCYIVQEQDGSRPIMLEHQVDAVEYKGGVLKMRNPDFEMLTSVKVQGKQLTVRFKSLDQIKDDRGRITNRLTLISDGDQSFEFTVSPSSLMTHTLKPLKGDLARYLAEKKKRMEGESPAQNQ